MSNECDFGDFSPVHTIDLNGWCLGRRMSLEAVESVAQGRVWTGVQALEAGLVDELGGLMLVWPIWLHVLVLQNLE